MWWYIWSVLFSDNLAIVHYQLSLKCVSVDQTLLSCFSMRESLNIFAILVIIHSYSCGDLEPKTSEMEGHLWCANQEYSLPCATMFLSTLLGYARVRSSALLGLQPKPKASNPKVLFKGRVMESRRQLTRMKDTLDILRSSLGPNGKFRASNAGQNGDSSTMSSNWSRHAHSASAHW